MPDENKIETPMDAVSAAFEDVKEDEVVGLDTEPVVEDKPADEPKDEPKKTDTDETPADNPDEEPKEEVLTAPTQVKGDFAKDHWESTPTEAKKEIIRLAEENEKNFRRAAEAEYNAKKRREVLKPVLGYVKQTAEQANISEDEVIRNSVDIVQALNDNPTQTACQMIAGHLVRFDDPVSVIDTIAKTYGLKISHNYKQDNVPADYNKMKQEVARQEYERRQAKYVSNEPSDDRDEERLTATTTFLEQNADLKARMESDQDFEAAFVATVQNLVTKDPYMPYSDILNRAARQFAAAPAAPQVSTTIVEKKNKVVAPKRTNPIVNQPTTEKQWTPQNTHQQSGRAARNAVMDAMRELGLDE